MEKSHHSPFSFNSVKYKESSRENRVTFSPAYTLITTYVVLGQLNNNFIMSVRMYG